MWKNIKLKDAGIILVGVILAAIFISLIKACANGAI